MRFFCLFMAFLLFVTGSALCQAPPCQAGTMANIVNQSCSIGGLTFNFQNDFNAGVAVAGPGTFSFLPISPASIQFVPINNGTQIGFQLVTNIVEAPDGQTTTLSTHSINFSYLPQANPGFEIIAESMAMDASSLNSNSIDSLIALAADDQCYSATYCSQVFPDLRLLPGLAPISKLFDSRNLEFPALISLGGFGPGIPTTTLQSVATGTDQVALRSATILYTVGPVLPLPKPAAVTYVNIDLPGQLETFASNINSSGKIVGSFLDSLGVFHGYITDDHGGYTTIDFPGAIATFGGGINDRGDIVGAYTDALGTTHGFSLIRGAFSTIDFPGAFFTDPIELNNSGEIVGFYQTPDFGAHGFTLKNGVFTSVDHGPRTGRFALTQVIGVNDEGDTVGDFFDPDILLSFVASRGTFQPFRVPAQGDTFSGGINNSGDIVGNFTGLDQLDHGFLQTHGGYRTVDFPGGNSTLMNGINSSEQMVGVYNDDAGNTHSFLASPRSDDLVENAPQVGAPVSSPTFSCEPSEWSKHPEHARRLGSCGAKQR